VRLIITTFLALIFLGCGTIKETTTTTTEAIKIPATIVHDTTIRYLTLKKEGYAFVRIDSLKQWTLENLCKGEISIDTAGIKATFSYSWKKAAETLSDSLNKQSRVIETLKAEVVNKEREIEATKKTTETKTTPGDWWIFVASAKFWIPFSILSFILGAVVIILLRLKTTLLAKIIP
jgi:hypothetical protein